MISLCRNQVVLITGSSSGIGESLAHKFYSCGCKVILAARRVGELERVRRDLLNTKLNNGIQSIRPEIIQLDLGELDQLTEKVNQILSSSPQIDILINNAGVSMLSGVRTVKPEVDTRVMNINYFGTISLTKAILPSMIERKQGTIVFVSSIVGRFSFPYCSSYTASKHAVQAFADCLRSEIADDNIKVVVSSPGFVKTDIIKKALTGSGGFYGVSTPAIENGQKPDDCANDIFRAVLRGDKEIVPMKFISIVWIRSLFPSIYFNIMYGRARAFEARHKVAHIV
ncbi:hypothetical protein HA402_002875 [Bradysia odoriphaga]|nr:hypothetical protein HA402_002875 [Bradysia odoriphaga]